MSAAEKIIYLPKDFPLNTAQTLVEKWGEAVVMDILEDHEKNLRIIRDAVLPEFFAVAEDHIQQQFRIAADEVVYHEFSPDKKNPWNIALHDNSDSLNNPELLKSLEMSYDEFLDYLEELQIINGHCHASGSSMDGFVDRDALAANDEFFNGEASNEEKLSLLQKIWKMISFAADRTYNAFPFPYKRLNEYNHKNGILGGCVAVGQTVYRTNNGYIIEAVEEAKGRAMSVASVPLDPPANDEEAAIEEEYIRKLYESGVRGFRFTGVQRLAQDFDINKVMAFDERLRSYGLEGVNINLYLQNGELQEYKKQILKIKSPVILDHCAIPDVFGDPEESYKCLAEILENPKNMVKGPGPERIMGANINDHLKGTDPAALAHRQKLLDKKEEFGLSEDIIDALENTEKTLSAEVCAELAINAKLWDAYVLPIMKRLIKEFPDQFIFGTDAQHPNLLKPVNDGQLMIFAFKAAYVEGDLAKTKENYQKIFHDNAAKAYPGHDFRRDEDYIRNPDPEGNPQAGAFVRKAPEPNRTLVLDYAA